MALLTDEDRAARLARAILADIQLYHHDAIAEGSPQLKEAIAEGRALFQSRADPSLYPLFENALADSHLAPWGPNGGGTYRARPPTPFGTPLAPERPQPNVALILLIALTAIGVGVLYYYFTARNH